MRSRKLWAGDAAVVRRRSRMLGAGWVGGGMHPAGCAWCDLAVVGSGSLSGAFVVFISDWFLGDLRGSRESIRQSH